jgi:hypothetical protein
MTTADDGTHLTPTAPPVEVTLVPTDLVVRRPPALVLAEAREAARAVAEVIASNPHKVILNGRQYLQFADWQVLGRFYGVSAKIVATEYVEQGETCGYVAKAIAIRADGMEISAAEASCATDEPKWSHKPLFQLRSMAQTRAAAKCLRNVLSFVPTLAGFADTPAEEVIDDGARALAPRRRKAATPGPDSSSPAAVITSAHWDHLKVLREAAGWSRDDVKAQVHAMFGIDDLRAMTPSQLEALAAHVQQHPHAGAGQADMPF